MSDSAFDLSEIPQPIKIGYRTIGVVPFEHWEEHRSGCFAEFDNAKAEIRLTRGSDRQQSAESLLHEILHGIWLIFGLPQDGQGPDRHLTEERCVSCISNGLATVMRDNPDVFDWMKEALTGSPDADSQ